MSGDRVTSTGLTMPPDFPVEPYEAILNTLRQHRESAPDAWREFAVGWNALSYRYAAVAEHDEAFSQSIRTDGLSPQPPARYRQEDHLFAFFVCGLSALEIFAYGSWAMVWATEDADFALSTLDERKKVKLWSLRDRLEHRYSAEPLALALGELLGSKDFTAWANVRNALTHRGGPGRLHKSVPQSSTAWGDMRLDEQTTARRRAWLAASLGELLSAAEFFSRDHLLARGVPSVGQTGGVEDGAGDPGQVRRGSAGPEGAHETGDELPGDE